MVHTKRDRQIEGGGVVENIVSFSGGKDSTAMLFKMLELNMPIDEVIYADR